MFLMLWKFSLQVYQYCHLLRKHILSSQGANLSKSFFKLQPLKSNPSHHKCTTHSHVSTPAAVNVCNGITDNICMCANLYMNYVMRAAILYYISHKYRLYISIHKKVNNYQWLDLATCQTLSFCRFEQFVCAHTLLQILKWLNVIWPPVEQRGSEMVVKIPQLKEMSLDKSWC